MGALSLAGLLAGGGTVLGLVLLASWWWAPAAPRAPATVFRHTLSGGVGGLAAGPGRRTTIATIAGLCAWALTRWPAAGLISAVAVWGVPILFGTARAALRDIERVEALEEWVRRLADVLVVGMGIGQAIVVTARSAPAAVSTELDALVARVSARWSLEEALRAFADDIDDPAGDLVVAALVLAGRRKGPGVAAALAALADALADEVTMRRRVEADRAKPRATARAVTVITLLVVGAGLLNGAYLAPYAEPLGQLVLLGITALFVGALAWMRAMTIDRPPVRLLRVRDTPGATS